MTHYNPHPASYKDPSGFIFESDGILYRQVNQSYAAQYDLLMSSGLYDKLVKNKLLVAHKEINGNLTQAADWYKTLQPEIIFPLSYAYEWCFEQLQDAALHTLNVLQIALEHGMILKDATPFNIQFHHGKPVLIDTLSFEQYDPAQPWIAYRQFCECFLFPLYLQHYLKTDTGRWLSIYINGIPVEVTAKLLPWKSRFNLGARLHVFLQQSVKTGNRTNKTISGFSKTKLLNVINHLQSIIKNLSSNNSKTTWSNYYDETILGEEYLRQKENLFRKFCAEISFDTVLDMGANDGFFSKILAEKTKQVIATDADTACISSLYSYVKEKRVQNILPLIVDTINPSPSIGFNNLERSSFHQRVQTDLVVSLALLHHLAIAQNIPLRVLADYFNTIAPQLIIEFVPKKDPKVQQLLSNRKDIFSNYTVENFENVFSGYFSILKKENITGTERILYLMKRK